MTDEILTQQALKELLHYDPITGAITWRERRVELFEKKRKISPERICKIWNNRFAGNPAGSLSKQSGYIVVNIAGKLYQSHRLIYLYMIGKFPKDCIDHINHDRSDNRWCNLRSVTRLSNQRNQSRSKVNVSGVTGVSWDKSRSKWRATIHIEHKACTIGRYTEKDDAIRARREALVAQGYHPNHGT